MGDWRGHRALKRGPLRRAVAAGAATFPMSGGGQLRDYLPVELAADHLVALALRRREPELFLRGEIVPRKRARGRPRKNDVAA